MFKSALVFRSLIMAMSLGLVAGCGENKPDSQASANTGVFNNGGVVTTVPAANAVYQPMQYGSTFYQQMSGGVSAQFTISSSCTSSCQQIASVSCTTNVPAQSLCTPTPFVMTVPGTVDPSGQVTYQHAHTCSTKNEILGSLMFEVLRLGTSNQGQVNLVWNAFTRRGPADPAVSHYRVVVYGSEDMNPASTWVSPKVFGTAIALTPGVLGDSSFATNTVVAGPTEAANLQSLQLSAGRPLGSMISMHLNSSNKLWYDVYAMDANDRHVIVTDRAGVRHISMRHFDVAQIPCTATIVAGFCSGN